MESVSYLSVPGGRLAYVREGGESPGIIFLGGFRSDMSGVKAIALEEFCRARGQAFVRFDYRGHGQSSGRFEECTLSDWKEDALAVLTKLTRGPQVLVGSSMGGWLALLLALAKPRRVAGIVGIAPAPDFTEHLIWEKLTPRQQDALRESGKILVPSEYGEPYPITADLILDGRKHLLLQGAIPIHCPVRLLHGMKDDDVPWEVSMAINEKLGTKDVKTILIEDGTHRLSEPADIEKIQRVTGKLLEHIKKNVTKT